MLALLIVCAAVNAGCSTRSPQVLDMADVPKGPLCVALFPLENLSGKPAPLNEIQQALLQKIVRRGGASVLMPEDLARFMERHRVRYTGGVDTATARALRDEAGVDAVLITSLEQYSASDPPAITVTQRLVSTEAIPRVVWMENVALTGEDSPGILGLGLIHDINLLQEKGLERLSGSLADFFSGRAISGNSRGGRFAPPIVFQSPFLIPGRRYTVAVAPFSNHSDRFQADEIMALHFTQQLIGAGIFDVVDPGVVREQLLHYRVIMKDGASISDADLIQNSVQADLIVTGEVLSYKDFEATLITPNVEFEIMVFEKKRKKIVWASWSFNQGDQGVYFFDWGRIKTAGTLASKMATAVVRDITSLGRINDPRLIQELSRGDGTWVLLENAFPALK